MRREYDTLLEFSKSETSKKPSTTIAVDFDGTLVEHKFPKIGKINDDCFEILKHWIKEYNVGIILDTMRSDEYLEDAVDFCEAQGLKFYGVGKHPTQEKWTNSNKAHAHYSIDDRNVGCPLKHPKEEMLPRVDWDGIVKILEPKLKENFEKFG